MTFHQFYANSKVLTHNAGFCPVPFMDTSLKFFPKQVLYVTVKTRQPLSPAVSCLPKDKEV